MKRYLLLLALTVATARISAAPTFTLLPPLNTLERQGRVTVELVGLNTGAAESAFEVPPKIAAEIVTPQRTWPVQLVAETTPAVTIAPGGFAARRYGFELPSGVDGTISLELKEPTLPALRAVLKVGSPASGDTHPETAPLTSVGSVAPATSAYARTFAGRLGFHEPIYFIYGPDTPAAKFQFSFKYRLFDLDSDNDRNLRSVQFAYTQRSLWDIDANSSPFYDTSYMPELMFESLAPMPRETSDLFTWLGYQIAYKHESNGRADDVSRSLNTIYLRTFFSFGAAESWHLILVPEAFAYIGDLSNNPQLKDYRGYGQLRAILGYKIGPALVFTGMAGKDFDHRTVQLDFTVPLDVPLIDLKLYLLVQYFNGYGESLLHYQEKSETIRAGFSLIR